MCLISPTITYAISKADFCILNTVLSIISYNRAFKSSSTTVAAIDIRMLADVFAISINSLSSLQTYKYKKIQMTFSFQHPNYIGYLNSLFILVPYKCAFKSSWITVAAIDIPMLADEFAISINKLSSLATYKFKIIHMRFTSIMKLTDGSVQHDCCL